MKKSRFTDEQILWFLKQVEAGAAVMELWRKHGFSDASLDRCAARAADPGMRRPYRAPASRTRPRCHGFRSLAEAREIIGVWRAD